MSYIALPQKVDFKKDEKNNQCQITIEPCWPGYGVTLANSLRRVLLSSLPGAAVVGVKIKGATHEFTALPHVKEDVLNIILNLKKLRLKVHSDEVIKLELDIHGEKEVKAGDIAKNSQVEIINSDLVLANVTDMAGNLNMEIYVSKGMGYETVESRELKNNEIGYIEVDSIFSPILSVGVNIENVRVGKMTNWDKIILNVITDGTIDAEDAFNKSVEILISQFSALSPKNETEAATAVAETEAEEEPKEEAEETGEKKKRGRPKKI